MAPYIISIIGLIASPVTLVILVHLITAAVSSEQKSQRDEMPDMFRTVMWGILWIAVSVLVFVAIGIASTL